LKFDIFFYNFMGSFFCPLAYTQKRDIIFFLNIIATLVSHIIKSIQRAVKKLSLSLSLSASLFFLLAVVWHFFEI